MSYSEEDYYGEKKKDFKNERKIARANDRSQYKKTDQDKIKKHQIVSTEGERGRVISITLYGIEVYSKGEVFLCSLKGTLKQQSTRLKNLVAVGDFVRFVSHLKKEGVILSVEPRGSILSRADNLSRTKEQLIAVNVDQVMITTSVILPSLKSSLIDRYLIAASKGKMTPVLVINKMDYLDDQNIDPQEREKEKALLQQLTIIYEKIGIKVISVSVNTSEGMEALKETLKDKVSVFSGQSGVGKSSIVNFILGTDFKVAGIVGRTKKGKHTTTTSRLIPLEGGGFCIDTPGIRSFGLWNIAPAEIKDFFYEFEPYACFCKYGNCCHLKEEGCAVKDALDKNQLSIVRYESYVSLMENVNKKHYNR
ncbi:MAG: ribosome small subunit-dependent GTPase A [Rhabdochlamydiaceae bacterium]